MQNIKLMTNIEYSYGKFLDFWSKKSKKTKRVIIEEALDLYMDVVKKNNIYSSYEKMSGDLEYSKEMIDISEMGMEYFLTESQSECKKI